MECSFSKLTNLCILTHKHYFNQFLTDFYSRYDKALNDGKRNGIRRAFYTGVGLGVTFVVLYGAYSLAFWLGTTFIADGRLTVKTVITVGLKHFCIYCV